MSKRTAEDSTSSCAFTFSDGRQCRMLRSSSRSKYCVHHNRKLRHLREVEHATLDLYEPICRGFVAANGLAQSMSRLFACVAEERISPKQAVAMSRVAAILLKAIPLANQEFRDVFLDDYYSQLVEQSFGKLPDFHPDEDADDDPSQSEQAQENVPGVDPPVDLRNTDHSELPETVEELVAKVGP